MDRDTGMSLLHEARQFWYNNTPGAFRLGRAKINRRQFQVYGGPSGELRDCKICQRSEWLSRVMRQNKFEKHKCPTASVAEERCEKQGDLLWENWHQDFTYAYRTDASLAAPRCAFLITKLAKSRFSNHICDQGVINLRRQLAQACQVDLITNVSRDMSKYDFMFMMCRPGYIFRRPDIPIVMYAHDLWKQHDELQRTIDHVRPDYFLTPFPSSWTSKYKLPPRTKVRFYCLSASQFFTRPNLVRGKTKEIILAGTINPAIYAPRKKLHDYIKSAAGEKRVTFWRNVGHIRNRHTGPAKVGKLRYLGWWSALLGEHKYAMFGEIADSPQPTFFKHYELLGSGAVPIFPVSPDFHYLGIKPMVHYVPLRTITGGSDKLRHILSHYPEYRRIAVNAVRWHKRNSHRMLFDRFEDLVVEVTGAKYPRRRI